MYLKCIEIQGFKSFANKIVLDFSKGITGIVGPNGSGKSNIADAVRWVLGEQKVKQLRGASMQDVIFAGTQTRRPLGFAYVAITLDNSDRSLALDYDEIVVSRRLYRSGESEYMLNGTACRLKDVNELFYDTGIGKEGYSIIGQGQIDKILSGKPEERRELFDEAVGIVKYKRRKAIAEKKLAEERANLSRVTDILRELERQVGPLKRQSESAREYLQLRDQLLVYDANLFVREMEQTLRYLDEIGEKERIAQEDLQHARQESEQLSRQYDEIDERLNALELKLSQAREEIGKSDVLKSNLTGQINVLKEQITSEQNSAAHYTGRIKTIHQDQFDRLAQLEENLATLHEIREQISFIQTNGTGDVEEENIVLDLELIQATLAETEATVHACMGDEYQLIPQKTGTVESGGTLNRDSFLENIKKKKEALRSLEERIAEVEQMTEADTALVARLQEDAASHARTINEKQQAYHATRSRLEAVRNLAERYEGYGNAVKMVMDQKQHRAGIQGVVADLIQVPREYETAIEIALGGTIQNVVTDNEATAKGLVGFLKEHRYGRATFLPLTTISGRIDQNYLRATAEPGAVGCAAELVEYQPQHKNLAQYLLGRCLVVDHIDHALAIQKKYRQSLKIVTLDGELLSPGGSISGGAYRNSSNLMGRKRELDEISARCEALVHEIRDLKKEQEMMENRRELARAAVEAHKVELNQLELERNTKTLGIVSEIQLEYSSLSTRTDFVTENLHRLNAELEKLTEEKHSLEEAQNNSAGVIEEKQRGIESLEDLIRNAEQAVVSLSETIEADQQTKEALLSERKAFFGRKDAISEQLLGLEKEVMRIQAQHEKLDTRLDSLTSYIFEEYHLTYQTALARYSEAYNNLIQLRGMIQALKARIKQLGPVNLEAIEEYKEVSERYEFLNNQYQDLIESEKVLDGIVAELDQGMRRQFEENFRLIQSEFNKVFKKLFGGGQGRLELFMEDGDVLNASISIIAEPPGKKLQNMMQLSGGEKALTAISLLFAIQNLKPSPFCLLDEIEAALDDSNVSRFADYLHNLTEHTQFILITHRRGTMEKADRLFGVTMQEKGVTALVSVDLVADELDG